MSYLSQMAQDDNVISNSKLTDAIAWFQSLPEQGQALLEQNGWLVGGLVGFAILIVIVKLGK